VSYRLLFGDEKQVKSRRDILFGKINPI